MVIRVACLDRDTDQPDPATGGYSSRSGDCA